MRRSLAVVAAALLAGLLPISAAHAEDSVQCRFSDKRLQEISGLAYSNVYEDIVWTHNDSGGGPKLYAIDTNTCETVAVLTMDGVPARDIEAIAAGVNTIGERVLWVGDIGDNTAARSTISLYEVREPRNLVSQRVRAIRYELHYSEPQDAEALIADPMSDQLWIVSKGLLGGSVWEVPSPLWPGDAPGLRKIGEEEGFVTDAAMAPDGSRYAVRDYSEVRIYRGKPAGELIARMPLPDQVQGEAVTWTPDGRGLLIASESDDRLMRVELPEEAWMRSAQPPKENPAPATDPPPTNPLNAAVGPVDRLGTLAVTAVIAGGIVFFIASVVVAIVVVARGRRA